MSRIVITVAGQGYKKGDTIEASAALVAALGANARAVTSAGGASPARDQAGESFAASNATG